MTLSMDNTMHLNRLLVDSAVEYLKCLEASRKNHPNDPKLAGSEAERKWKDSVSTWLGSKGEIYRTRGTGVDGPSGGGSVAACRQFDLIVKVEGFYVLFEVEASDAASYKKTQSEVQRLAAQNWNGPAIYCCIDGKVHSPTIRKWIQGQKEVDLTKDLQARRPSLASLAARFSS